MQKSIDNPITREWGSSSRPSGNLMLDKMWLVGQVVGQGGGEKEERWRVKVNASLLLFDTSLTIFPQLSWSI